MINSLKKIKTLVEFNQCKTKNKSRLYGCYPHVVKDKIYWQARVDSSNSGSCFIEYAIISDDLNKVTIPENNICLKKSLACQNFRVFYDTNPNVDKNERWKAIGGYHVGRSAVKNISKNYDVMKSPLHAELKDCNFSKKLEIKRTKDVVWPNETKLLFDDSFSHPRHANGFYIFNSKDGIDWKLHSEKPVLSTFTECEGEGVTLGSDNMPSIFYDPKLDEYTAYLRCNIKLGVRHVLVTSSKDLITWSTPKLIKKDPKFELSCENLYYFDAYYNKSLDLYVGFAPHFKNEIQSPDGSKRRYYDTKNLVMMSKDKINWKVVDNLFEDEKATGHMIQKHVVTLLQKNDLFYVCVNEKWTTKNSRLCLYQLEKKYLEDLKSSFLK